MDNLLQQLLHLTKWQVIQTLVLLAILATLLFK